MNILNFVGCGSVARTLGRLWAKKSVFVIGDVLNRSLGSAEKAVEFMGSGRPVDDLGRMGLADLYMIGTPDDRLAETCRALANSGLLAAGSIVFHVSGATRAAELGSARACGALAASVHPVKSFADPEMSAPTFEGTWCGGEGDHAALEVLSRAFEAIGGRMFSIDPEHKEIYHAASVFSCNYVTALLEVGIRAYVKAGIPRGTAFEIVEPIVRETIDNLIELETTEALTGPIARGDHRTVTRQIEALDAWNPEYGALYRRLGRIALDLSRLQGTASAESIAVLSRLLDNDDVAAS